MYDHEKEHLAFQPVRLKRMFVRNRIVRSATNTAMGNLDGSFSQMEYQMFDELSKNEVGLLITGHTYVSLQGQAKPNQTSMCEPKHLSKMQKITKRVHGNGAKIVAQLSHAGAGALVPREPAAPSQIFLGNGRVAHAMTLQEIDDTVRDFGMAAYLAQQAGFDAVQVHVAHGFLLCEYVSYGYNRRQDEYGGTARNRIRIVRRIVEEIKQTCGEDYPVLIKINSNSYEQNQDYWKDLHCFMEILEELEVEAVELSGYDFSTFSKEEHCYYLREATKLRKKYDVPMILVGGIRNLDDMEKVLESGIDMVSMSRPFIAEPDLLTRLKEGQPESRCVSCNQCHGLYLREGRRCILHPYSEKN
ncbi:MAG: NADH:flavin oxidoreductase [Lachnospiraceae bacterium]|nr:NADH:flavin oxidoreductase [Lachnospiraceae bacterium]